MYSGLCWIDAYEYQRDDIVAWMPLPEPYKGDRMSDLISRCELFNRLSTVQNLADAYAVINGMPTAERIPKSTKEKLLDILDEFADKTVDVEGGSYESARHKMCEMLDGE